MWRGLVGGVLICGVAACLAFVFVFASKARVDPHTLCPADGPAAATLLFVDATDPFTTAEASRVKAILERERDLLPQGGLLSVVVLHQKPGVDGPVLETAAALCNPGRDADPLTGNPRRAALRYTQAFDRPLGDAVAATLMLPPSQTSPIAEALAQAIEMQPVLPGDAQPSRIVILSDMMQHTKTASAYKDGFGLSALSALTSAPALRRFKRSAVILEVLPRPAHQRHQQTAVEVWKKALAGHGVEAAYGAQAAPTRKRS
jgi:hypothetical protein